MYRRIMVPLDGSSLGEYALPLALGLARRAGATVDLVHVCTVIGPNTLGGNLDAPVLGVSRREQMHKYADVYLRQLAGSLSARWEVTISATVLDGLVADRLYDRAIASAADLVVMTTHGYGSLARAWMGSVADKLVRRLPLPILLARPRESAPAVLEEAHERLFEHVLIPLDGSALAEEILAPAIALGTLTNADYTLVQAIEMPTLGYAPAAQAVALDQRVLEQWRAESQGYLESVATRVRVHGSAVRTHVTIGPPAIAIMDYAREQSADLIALSTHGRGGLARLLLGSVADKVVRGADVPILLQRPRGELSNRA